MSERRASHYLHFNDPRAMAAVAEHMHRIHPRFVPPSPCDQCDSVTEHLVTQPGQYRLRHQKQCIRSRD